MFAACSEFRGGTLSNFHVVSLTTLTTPRSAPVALTFFEKVSFLDSFSKHVKINRPVAKDNGAAVKTWSN